MKTLNIKNFLTATKNLQLHKQTLPVLQHVQITCTGGELFLVSNNLEHMLILEATADLPDFRAWVEFKKLSKVAGNGEISISETGISAGGFTLKYTQDFGDDFPVLSVDPEADIVVDVDRVMEAAAYASKDKYREGIQVIRIRAENGTQYTEATDGKTAYSHAVPGETAFPLHLWPGTLEILQTLRVSGKLKIEAEPSGRFVCSLGNGLTLVNNKEYDRCFPDIQRVFPKESALNGKTVFPANILEIVKKSLKLTESVSKAGLFVGDELRLPEKLTPESLTEPCELTASAPRDGHTILAVNLEYMKRALETTKTLTCRFTEPGEGEEVRSPLVFQADAVTVICMPLKAI